MSASSSCHKLLFFFLLNSQSISRCSKQLLPLKLGFMRNSSPSLFTYQNQNKKKKKKRVEGGLYDYCDISSSKFRESLWIQQIQHKSLLCSRDHICKNEAAGVLSHCFHGSWPQKSETKVQSSY